MSDAEAEAARDLTTNARNALRELCASEAGLEVGTDITTHGSIDMIKRKLAYRWGFAIWATEHGRRVAAELAKQEGN